MATLDEEKAELFERLENLKKTIQQRSMQQASILQEAMRNPDGALAISIFNATADWQSISQSHRDELLADSPPDMLYAYITTALRGYESEDYLASTLALYALIEGYAKQLSIKIAKERSVRPNVYDSSRLFKSLRDTALEKQDENGVKLYLGILEHWETNNNGSPEARNAVLHGYLKKMPDKELVDKLFFFARSMMRLYNGFSTDPSKHKSYNELTLEEEELVRYMRDTPVEEVFRL